MAGLSVLWSRASAAEFVERVDDAGRRIKASIASLEQRTFFFLRVREVFLCSGAYQALALHW